MYILGCGDYDEIIAWSLNGLSVIVKDTNGFAESVLPIFFKQSKFDSFTRKMRRWGFSTRRLHTPKGDLEGTSWAFQHPHFTKAGGFAMCYKVVTSTTHAEKPFEFVNEIRREGRTAAALQDIRQDCIAPQSSFPADTIRHHAPQENHESMHILQQPPFAPSAAFLLAHHRRQLSLCNFLSASQANDNQARRNLFIGHEMLPPDTSLLVSNNYEINQYLLPRVTNTPVILSGNAAYAPPSLGVYPRRNDFSRSHTMPSLPYQSINGCGPQFFRQDVGIGQRAMDLSNLSDSMAKPVAAGATHDNMFGMLNNDSLAYKRQLMLEALSSFP